MTTYNWFISLLYLSLFDNKSPYIACSSYISYFELFGCNIAINGHCKIAQFKHNTVYYIYLFIFCANGKKFIRTCLPILPLGILDIINI